MATKISVVNLSTLVTDQQTTIMCQGLNKLLPSFCNDWIIPATLVVPLTKSQRPVTRLVVYLMDDSDVAGALGYHDEQNGTPYGKVFAKTILDNGGAVLLGAQNPNVFTIAQCLSHEIFEMLVDINCNQWWYTGSGNCLVAAEVSDPVQGNIVRVQVGNTVVGFSDWILPKWMDPQARTGPFNHLNTLTAPFTMARGGYMVKLTVSGVNYVFGETVPEWLQNYSRDDKRLAARIV